MEKSLFIKCHSHVQWNLHSCGVTTIGEYTHQEIILPKLLSADIIIAGTSVDIFRHDSNIDGN